MAFNGSGTFSLYSPGNPVVTGTTISSTWANNTLNDIANNGLSYAITKDGQQTLTANIPFAGFKITGLGAGSAATDSVRLSQLQNGSGATLTTIAGTNTITAVGSPVITAYAANQTFRFTPANTNTGATTLNIDGLGAKNIYLNNAALVGGEIVINVPLTVFYDGTQFQIISNGSSETVNQAVNSYLTTITGVSGTNTILGSLPFLTAYASGQKFTLIPANTNTGATVININSIGAKNVFFGGSACSGYELPAGVPVEVEYDGTQFNIIGAGHFAGMTAYTPTLTADTGTYGAATVTLARYLKIGKLLFVHINVAASVSSGSPTEFRLTYPNSWTGVSGNSIGVATIVNNSVSEIGFVYEGTSTGYMSFQRLSGGAYSGSCRAIFNGVFEVN